mgnify:FL=1
MEPPHYVRDPMARSISGDLTSGIRGIDLSVKDLSQLETGEFAGSSDRGGKENV